jgi:hypothetical protein
MYMVPSLPLTRVSEPIFRVFAKIHEEAASLNGSAGIPQRPMLAAAFPCTAVVKGRYSVFERVLDRAFAGAYVQPLALDTKRDSVEKLTRYAQFLTHAKSSGLPVVAGRASAFGLVLAAAGIDFFDSGLSLAGSFSLSRLDRPPRAPKPGDRSGGPKPALYFHQFLAPIEHHDAEAMLSNPAVRAQLSCRIGECGSADYKYSLENPRAHFFHTRQQELRDIRALPTIELRVQRVYDWIQSAIENGRLVNRIGVAPDGKPLDFSYLDRWLGVLSRLATPVAVANQ